MCAVCGCVCAPEQPAHNKHTLLEPLELLGAALQALWVAKDGLQDGPTGAKLGLQRLHFAERRGDKIRQRQHTQRVAGGRGVEHDPREACVLLTLHEVDHL
jgi:hypothetical protein